MKVAAPRRPRSQPDRKPPAQSPSPQASVQQPSRQDSRGAAPKSSLPGRLGELLRTRRKSPDRFYFNALVLQAWLGHVHRQALELYAQRGSKAEGRMQTGQTWQSFSELFEPLGDLELLRLFENLLRFAKDEAYPPARAFFLAYAPLAFEHDVSGEYLGPGVRRRAADSAEAVRRVRRTLRRWCDWLEALTHFQTHELWHVAPACFAPDLEKRERAILQLDPRFLAHWSKVSLSCAHSRDVEVVGEELSKLPELGPPTAIAATTSNGFERAEAEAPVSSAEGRNWPYPLLDKTVILFWPLLKRHRWSYRDLLKILRPHVQCEGSCPCRSEKELAAYCAKNLGLGRIGMGVSRKGGRPPGQVVAERLFKFLPNMTGRLPGPSGQVR